MYEKVFQIDGEDYILRDAKLEDCEFLAETIVQSEMSGTGKCGMAYLYDLTVDELKGYLVKMLEEEIDGCEISLSSFMVIEHKGEPVAAAGGWVEGYNEDELPSAILKANLCAYCLPKENILKSQERIQVIRDLQTEREYGTLQYEYSYVKKDYRGLFLNDSIIEAITKKNKNKFPNITKTQSHVFISNKAVMMANKLGGKTIALQLKSTNPNTIEHFPSDTLVVFESNI